MCLSTATEIVRILDGCPMSVAIVDSDEQFSILLTQVVEDLGFIVKRFDHGRDFERAYSPGKFDVVILSWEVVPVSGAQMVESIRNAGEPYPSLIVECDGGDSISFQLALLPVGFLFKPFDAPHLMGVLSKAVKEGRK